MLSRLRYILLWCALVPALIAGAQINTDQVLRIGRNSLAFDDYVLAIQYFNQVIQVKPYLAKPYFYRGVAKYNLDDFKGAETDASLCIERNPFIVDAYRLRGVSRQNSAKYAEAIGDYDKVLESLPHDKMILFNKAIFYKPNITTC